MSVNPQAIPAPSDIYERAFVRTVLKLRGVSGPPTPRQIEEARSTLQHCETRMAKMKDAGSVSPYGWLRGRLAEPAAVEHAFMFVTFQSVLPPNALQLKALNEWLVAGKLR